jgi:hypothetical protein
MRIELIIVIASGLILFSCELFSSVSERNETNASGDTLSFQTLSKSFQIERDLAEPVMVVLRDPDKAESFLKEYLDEVPVDHALFDVDYSESFVIGVFTGERPNTSYSVDIEEILAESESVLVYITENGSAAGFRAIVWPAHFVLVNQQEIGDRDVVFHYDRYCEMEPCVWQE